jgi:hypothetical protein
MSNPTEWDIAGGNFNKPVEFPETIKGEHDRLMSKLEENPVIANLVNDEPLITQEQADNYEKTLEVKYAPVKKSKRINPDALPVLYTAVALVSILMLSSFVVSFSGIYEVSAWTGLPSILQWLPAFFIDAAILAYTISLVVFKARGESTWRTLAGLSGFAAMSVIANIAHTVNHWNGQLVDYRGWIGVAITAAAPIAVLLASEEITRLAFEKE